MIFLYGYLCMGFAVLAMLLIVRAWNGRKESKLNQVSAVTADSSHPSPFAGLFVEALTAVAFWPAFVPIT